MEFNPVNAYTVTESYNQKSGNKNNGDSFAEILQQVTAERSPKGYAYVDKYGFSHVVSAYETALQFAKNDTEIYGYHNNYWGGYARDQHDTRIALPLPDSIPYGNDRETNVIGNAAASLTANAAATDEKKVISLNEFQAQLPGAISLLPAYYEGIKIKLLSAMDMQKNELFPR